MEQNNFNNFGRQLPKEHFYEIILKLDHWPRRKCCLKVSFFFFIFALAAILFSGAELFKQFLRGSSKRYFCKLILKSGHWPIRRCCLQSFLFLALAAILLRGA